MMKFQNRKMYFNNLRKINLLKGIETVNRLILDKIN